MSENKIGNVKLNYSYYSGKDFYSEGNIEEELLEIVRKHDEKEFIDIIADKYEWSFLYHLSPLRGNIIEWIPFKNTDSVLEIGAGCGAITGTLAKKVSNVTCIELSKRRSEINAHRNKKCNNVEIIVGNFEDIEKHIEEEYDYITLIGVLEYASSYINGNNPYENFLKTVKKHLKPNGKVIIAIENKFGLKYWAGCKEDHLEKYFESLESYSNTKGVRTFSKAELEKMSEKAGFKESRFYYPYPDYKLPLMLFSDQYLPSKGELCDNIKNYDQERMQFFDEEKVYDNIIDNGMYPFFSNSYLLILSNEANDIFTNQIYIKYNERDAKLDVRTDIVLKNGKEVVEKIAITEEAGEHLNNIYESYKLLEQHMDTSQLGINRCRRNNKKLQFEFIKGSTLESRIDFLLKSGQFLKWIEEIERYFKFIKGCSEITSFEMTNEFKRIFGDIDIPSNTEAFAMANIDAIPRNIIIDEEEKWNMIDYEWTFNFPIPSKFILFRCLVYYIFTSGRQDILDEINIFKVMEITEEEQELFWAMENNFQVYVRGNLDKLKNAYPVMLKERYLVIDEIEQNKENIKTNCIQVYLDYGNGFSEKNSFYEQKTEQNEYFINLPIGVKNIRIDPAIKSCIVKINMETGYNGRQYKLIRSSHNGKEIKDNLILFENNDSQIYYFDIESNTQYVKIGIEKSCLSSDIVYELDNLAADSEELKAENEELKVENEQLKRENEELKVENEELRRDSEELQAENNKLKLNNNKLQEENSNLSYEKELNYNNYMAIKNSFFWKLTYLPRRLVMILKK